MPTFLRHPVLAVLAIATLGWYSPVFAQWRIGAEVGAARFWGGSLDSGTQTSIRPYRPTTFGAGVEHQSGRYALGLQVQYADASLGLEGPDATVSAPDAFTIVSVSPEVAVRVATLGPGDQLRLHAGPLIEHWDLVDQDSRTRVGVQGSVSLDLPLG